MSEQDLYIGIDVGTGAVKGGLFARDGSVLAHAGRSFPTDRPRPGIVEQDPRAWLAGIEAVVDALLAGREAARVAAVGLCSQVNSDVFVDGAGEALAPAIVWQDVRAAEAAAVLDAAVAVTDKHAWWGAPMPIGASHVLARMAWMAQLRPEIFAASRYVLSPKDYCLMRLTGIAVADPIASFGVVGQDLRYIEPLIALMPGAAERLPPLMNATRIVGDMPLGTSGAKAPVVAGTMDAWSALLGCGVHRPGQGMYVSGTSEILAVSSQGRIGAPGVVTFPTVDGLNVHAGPTQSGGDSLRWWAEAIGSDPQGVLDLAGRADRDGSRVLFLPHLEGERAPLWDSDLRGAFIGLDSQTRGPAFALAVLEGVALSARLLLMALDAAAGGPVERLFLAGGGARSDLWSQIRADCLGRPLDRLAFADVGCLGAAIMASVGIGHFGSVSEAIPAMSHVERIFLPDPRRKARYAAMFEHYAAATTALKPLGTGVGDLV